MSVYTFEEVRDALARHWGLTLVRAARDGDRDGRWDTSHSKTGYLVYGQFPGTRHTWRRFRSLVQIVRAADLADVIESRRDP